METKKIYRGPVGNQDRFLIAMVNSMEKNKRRFAELCKEMNCNLMNFENTNATEAKLCAVACEEVAINGLFTDEELTNTFRFATHREEIVDSTRYHSVSINVGMKPEELRMNVYRALMQGKIGIEYHGGMQFFRYIQDMNYRIQELGRTLIALNNQSLYASGMIMESEVLAEQQLPQGCAIGEFSDEVGNSYLMIQNQDLSSKNKKAFSVKLNKKYRVYRVNPHNGKHVLVKDCVDTFNLLVMPGDADLLRFQDVNEEPYLIEYIFRK